MSSQTQTAYELEYAELNASFRLLSEVRFKLLALFPILGGIAAFVLSYIGLAAGNETPGADWLLALSGSLFGFVITLGIVIYDQRNSELYNALVHRAKFLERRFRLDYAPGSLAASGGFSKPFGGQFSERPGKHRRILGIVVGHDLGLAFVWGPLLAVWSFPGAFALLRLIGAAQDTSRTAAAAVAATMVIVAISLLIGLDRQSARAYDEASRKNPAPTNP
jgi:hypothetical protein